jgi:putative restriction endonuclease
LEAEELVERLANIHTYPGARHKPLLLLLALAQLQHGAPRLATYADVEPAMRKLLVDYGDLTSTPHPEYPFWWLQTDGIWRVEGAEDIPRRRRDDAPSAAALRNSKAKGGFADDVHRSLKSNQGLTAEIARRLLEEFIPVGYHDAIIAELGLSLGQRAG